MHTKVGWRMVLWQELCGSCWVGNEDNGVTGDRTNAFTAENGATNKNPERK